MQQSYPVPNPALDRAARIRNYSRYAFSATPQAIDADLAVLRALVPKKQKRITTIKLIAIGVLFGLPLVGCGMSDSSSRGGPLILALMAAVPIALVLWLVSGARLPVRLDKTHTAGSLLRRIDFAAGAPVTLQANLGESRMLVDVRRAPAGVWTNAQQTTAHRDDWLSLAGRLSNSINLTLTRSVGSSRTAGRKGYTIASRTVLTDTVILLYPPELNPRLPSFGPSVGQYLRLGEGTRIDSLVNEPGALSVLTSSERMSDLNYPQDLAGLVAQLVALVDPARQLVLVDRDAWPAYLPGPGELSAVSL